MVGLGGLEPPTSRLSGVRSSLLSYKPIYMQTVRFVNLSSPCGGDEEDRTPDPLLARQVLSQLSYTPIWVQCAFHCTERLKSLPLYLVHSIFTVLLKVRLASFFLHCLFALPFILIGLSKLNSVKVFWVHNVSSLFSNRQASKNFSFICSLSWHLFSCYRPREFDKNFTSCRYP